MDLSTWAAIGIAGNLFMLIVAYAYYFVTDVMIPENWIEPWSRM